MTDPIRRTFILDQIGYVPAWKRTSCRNCKHSEPKHWGNGEKKEYRCSLHTVKVSGGGICSDHISE